MFLTPRALLAHLSSFGVKSAEPASKRWRRTLLTLLRRPGAAVAAAVAFALACALLAALRRSGPKTVTSPFLFDDAGDARFEEMTLAEEDAVRGAGEGVEMGGSTGFGRVSSGGGGGDGMRNVGGAVGNAGTSAGGAGGSAITVGDGAGRNASGAGAGAEANTSAIAAVVDKLNHTSWPSGEHPDAYAFSVSVVIPGARAASPARLRRLLASLADASYPTGAAVALSVHVVDDGRPASLAEALGSDDREVALEKLDAVLTAQHWHPGPKNFVAHENVDAWIVGMEVAPSVLVFADVAAAVAPGFPDFLHRARRVPTTGPPVLGVALDAVISAGAKGDAVAEEAVARAGLFFPAASAFAPAEDAWAAFLRWRTVRGRRTRNYGLRGGVAMETVGLRPTGNEALGGIDLREQFAEFVHLYGGHILHPVLSDGELLVDRDPANAAVAEGGHQNTAAPDDVAMFGASAPPSEAMPLPLRLRTRSASTKCCGLSASANWTHPLPSEPVVYTLTGKSAVGERLVPIGSNKSSLGSLVASFGSAESEVGGAMMVTDQAHAKAVRKIADYAHKRGGGVVSFTLVTGAFVETTYSWICNVLAVDALPRALVFGASSASVVQDLRAMLAKDSRVAEDDVLLVDLSSAIHAEEKSPGSGLDFGSSEYWQLMLERTALLRDVLDAGVGVLHFETDQIWFGSPMEAIDSAVVDSDEFIGQAHVPDMVITINTRGEASGNFFLLRPTLATRHLWSVVTEEFLHSYRKSLNSKEAKRGQWHYIQNDQSLFTRYGLGQEKWYVDTFPVARYAVLDKQRFVDGTWYLDFEDDKGAKVARRVHYTSPESLEPVVLNNNFMIGVDGKKKRAQRFSHWFWNGYEHACSTKFGKRENQTRVQAAPRSRFQRT